MNQVSFTIQGSQCSVTVPFALNSCFKDAFPRAKWNRDVKAWAVGREDQTRVNTWKKEVANSGMPSTLFNTDFDEIELNDIRASLESKKAELAAVRKEILMKRAALACLEDEVTETKRQSQLLREE